MDDRVKAAGNHRIVPLILAGGSGTRLWPLSRASAPKQFLPLVGDLSPYQQTLLRVTDASLFAPPIVIVNEAFRFFAERQARDVGAAVTILLEPAGRNSAPAIAAGTAYALRQNPDTVVLALASDHVVLDVPPFRAAARTALEGALTERIVTFGVRPTSPHTGYGYIRPGASINGNGLSEVDAFVEKPDRGTAVRYLQEGLLWNSGNFLFRADVMLGEIERFAPDIRAACDKAVSDAVKDLDFIRLEPASFAGQIGESIDYAVMERTRRAAVVELDCRWSDIGSWDSLAAVGEADGAGNVTTGDVALIDTTDSLVRCERGFSAVIGLDSCVVVVTDDAVLVSSKDKVHKVRDIVVQLRAANRPEADEHRRVYRPWGHYQDIDAGLRFRVKRIVVDPGQKLSLQKHVHRAEHWVVVRGTANVVRGEEDITLTENESIYLPLGVVHRLENPGRIPLELIEVQTGSYLGEDDIVRLEDVYRRVVSQA